METGIVTMALQSAVTAPTQYAPINGKKIAYRETGKGDPFIFCNRFRGILDTWDPLFIDELATKYRVILFDYSGIGLSSGELPVEMAKGHQPCGAECLPCGAVVY